MYAFKLQAGALLCCTYFIAAYIRGLKPGKRTYGDRLFAFILFMAPVAAIFDGATAVTVNMLDKVPLWINLALHAAFFISMDSILIALFAFIVYQTVGIQSKRHFLSIIAPGIIINLLVIYYINRLHFIKGRTTNYSMGISVYLSYGLMLFYFILIALFFVTHSRSLIKTKLKALTLLMFYMGTLLAVQMIIPESLITALLPIGAVSVLYVNFQDPALQELRHYNEEMITGFATLVESRDLSTGNHIKHTKGYVEIILNEMRKSPRYSKVITQDFIENVLNAAPMHDIGKIAIPDQILCKPAKLTDEEFEVMKTHTTIGLQLLEQTFAELNDTEYKRIVFDVAKYHHEKWNGCGYPEGLKGEEIPLSARIMAIADVFEAVSSERCYKKAYDIDTCFKIIKDGAGTDFDPVLANLFVNAEDKVRTYYMGEKSAV
ncbi:MAG: HD domain-containing protein [Lachnospiraceae bacterium]|nr:HD domain-containing protein [Lachnospiraceae bacterium]